MKDFFCTVEMEDGNFYTTYVTADDIRTAMRVFNHQCKRQFNVESITKIEVCTKSFIDKAIRAFIRDSEIYCD